MAQHMRMSLINIDYDILSNLLPSLSPVSNIYIGYENLITNRSTIFAFVSWALMSHIVINIYGIMHGAWPALILPWK